MNDGQDRKEGSRVNDDERAAATIDSYP